MATKLLFKRNTSLYADRAAALAAIDTHTFEAGLPVLFRYDAGSGYTSGILALGTDNGTGSDCYIILANIDDITVIDDYVHTPPTTPTAGYVPTWSVVDDVWALNTGFSIETTLTGGSTALARADAIKTYIDGIINVANALQYKGVIDCSTNPNYPAADAGFTYFVSVAGKIGGASGIAVEVGDMLICKTDSTATGTHATVGANWNIIQANLTGTVTGPASATDGNIPLFDGATGKILKNSTYSPSSFATAAHNHSGTYQPLDNDLTAIAAITGTGILSRTAADTWSVSDTIDGGTF